MLEFSVTMVASENFVTENSSKHYGAVRLRRDFKNYSIPGKSSKKKSIWSLEYLFSKFTNTLVTIFVKNRYTL